MAEALKDSDVISQVFDMVDVGLVILDRDLRIRYWNRWMQSHCSIPPEKMLGHPVCDVFSNLNRPRFLNNCKAVFAFGHVCHFSQKLHRYLFPFKPVHPFDSSFEYMQQNCVMGPLCDENGSVNFLFIVVHDVTDAVHFEQKLVAFNMIDGLTNVHNRRSLEIHLKKEVSRHKRYGHPLSVIIFDLDHLKSINDHHGHQCGDHILQAVVGLIGNSIRSGDILARYGGDEFCCVLLETSMGAALSLAERFRQKIDECLFEFGKERIHLTISLGVASMSAKASSPDLLLKRAEDNLYMAKNRGCNRIEVSD